MDMKIYVSPVSDEFLGVIKIVLLENGELGEEGRVSSQRDPDRRSVDLLMRRAIESHKLGSSKSCRLSRKRPCTSPCRRESAHMLKYRLLRLIRSE